MEVGDCCSCVRPPSFAWDACATHFLAREGCDVARAMNPSSPTDETQTDEAQLVQRLVRGDADAVEELVATYTDDLFRFVYNQMGGTVQDTEDVVQETFVAALRAIRRFRGESKLRTWLFSIASHKVADRQRRAMRRPREVSLQDVTLPQSSDGMMPEQVLERIEVRQAVRKALMRLPPHYRTALVLKYVENMSVRGISQVMHKSEKSVESILVRARRLLAQILEGKHDRMG